MILMMIILFRLFFCFITNQATKDSIKPKGKKSPLFGQNSEKTSMKFSTNFHSFILCMTKQNAFFHFFKFRKWMNNLHSFIHSFIGLLLGYLVGKRPKPEIIIINDERATKQRKTTVHHYHIWKQNKKKTY